MPYCSIITCKNDSRRANITNGGISYHRYPKNPTIRKKWVEATGREYWIPTKISTICSKHFKHEDFLVKSSGHRYLIEDAIPTEKVVWIRNEAYELHSKLVPNNEVNVKLEHESNHSTIVELIPNSTTDSANPGPSTLNGLSSCQDPNIKENGQTSREKQLQTIIYRQENQIVRQRLQIKKMQARNRRYLRKINIIEDLLQALREKSGNDNLNLQ